MIKWYGHVIDMGDNRWPNRILTGLLDGRKGSGRPDMKWKKGGAEAKES